MKKKYSARLKVSKSRKSKLGKTKPNFNKMVKDQCKRYEQFSEKKIGETKPNLDKPTFNIELKEVEKIKVKITSNVLIIFIFFSFFLFYHILFFFLLILKLLP